MLLSRYTENRRKEIVLQAEQSRRNKIKNRIRKKVEVE